MPNTESVLPMQQLIHREYIKDCKKKVRHQIENIFLLSGENTFTTIFTLSLRLCLEAKECAGHKEAIYDRVQ